MASCWCWHESKRRSERKKSDERSHATSLEADAASSTPALSARTRRRAAAAPDSSKASTLGLLVGQILRQYSFHALEALVRSPARRNLVLSAPFSDDALGYFTERLDPGPTRQALLAVVRRAKRNKAFDNCRWIGLAIDGTGAGWRTTQGCSLCRPKHNAQKRIIGYQHSLVLITVVGTGLSLRFDVEPYGPGDSEYALLTLWVNLFRPCPADTS